MRSKIKKLLILISLFILPSCSQHLANFTMISTRPADIEKVDLNNLPTEQKITGTDSNFVFVFIPFGFPRLNLAVEDALTRGQGNLVVDASLYSSCWWFIVGQCTFKLNGIVVDTKDF